MSDVINLGEHRAPVCYTVRIVHHWDGSLEFLIEDVSDDPRSRASVLDAMRRIVGIQEPEVALAIAYENGVSAGILKLEQENARLREDLRLAIMSDSEYVKELERQIAEALAYSTALAGSLNAKHFPDNTQWKPLPDLYGVISQIDNMTTARVPHNPAI